LTGLRPPAAMEGVHAARRPPLLQAPVVQALLIQLLSFALVLALAFGAAPLAALELTIAHAVVLQALLAALLSRRFGLARWWIWIQLAFPPALAALHAQRLPSWLFLALFGVLTALYWTTFRTQVPYFPSRREVRDAVARLLPAQRALSFIDIGSGFGGLTMDLAGRRSESSFSGIEVAPLPWLLSLLRARATGSSARFLRGDYERLDLGGYDVVFAYLSPAAMPRLWQKARCEMRAGALLLSYEFPVPGSEPQIALRPSVDGPLLYGWVI
jgi:hypothetical protein